jgi:hypothetical protein
VVLHFLAALHPYYAVPPDADPALRWEYAGLLLSDDPVACDVVGLGILTTQRTAQGITPAQPAGAADYLNAACEQHRAGQSDRDQITLVTLGP